MGNDSRQPLSIGGWIIAGLLMAAVWISIKCWRHMRQRSPDWRGPTLLVALSWVCAYLLLRRMGGN